VLKPTFDSIGNWERKVPPSEEKLLAIALWAEQRRSSSGSLLQMDVSEDSRANWVSPSVNSQPGPKLQLPQSPAPQAAPTSSSVPSSSLTTPPAKRQRVEVFCQWCNGPVTTHQPDGCRKNPANKKPPPPGSTT